MTMTRTNDYEEAFKVVARWMTQNKSLKIVHKKTGAPCADTDKGILYVLPMNGLTHEEIMKARTFYFHEAGHIIHTGKSFWKGCRPALFSIFNSLEDARIESKLSGEHEGCRVAFEWASRHFNGKIAESITNAKEERPLWEACCAMGLAFVGVQPMWTLTPMARKYFDAAYATFCEVRTCTTAKQAFKLAEKIYDLLKAEKENEKEKQSQQQQGEGEQNEDDQDEDDQDEDDQGDDSDNGKGKGTEQREANDDEDGEPQSGGADDIEDEDEEGEGEGEEDESGDEEDESGDEEGASGSDGENDSDSDGSKKPGNGKPTDNGGDDTNDASGKNDDDDDENKTKGDIEDDLDDEAEGFSKTDELAKDLEEAAKNAANNSSDGYTSVTDNDEYRIPKTDEYSRERFDRMYKEVDSAVMSLARGLEQAIRVMTQKRKVGHMPRGKLDVRRLVPLVKGLDRAVFYRTQQGMDLDVAVSIVIDESGSMCSNMRTTTLLAIALGEVLDRIGIPFEVVGSTTKYAGGDKGMPELNGHSRTNPIVLDLFKTFGEQWKSIRTRITELSPQYHNVDGEVIEMAAKRLGARSENRKIIISLSDGEPYTGQRPTKTTHGTVQFYGDNLKNVCKAVRKAGIEIYGFGIETEDPKPFYGEKHFVGIMDIKELGTTFTKELVKIVTNGVLAAI